MVEKPKHLTMRDLMQMFQELASDYPAMLDYPLYIATDEECNSVRPYLYARDWNEVGCMVDKYNMYPGLPEKNVVIG